MLNIVGLGLRGIKSVTLESLDVIRSSDKVYFETYTSISPESTMNDIMELSGREIHIAGRELVESETVLINEAMDSNISLLVTGDPLTATTHNQLRFDAIKQGVEVRIYENSSIIGVIPGILGLMHYKFGPPVSIPFVTPNFFPTSIYDKIEKNRDMDLHTLLLLDLKDGSTMPVQEAVRILGELEKKRRMGVLSPEKDICVAIAVSQPGQRIIFGTIESIRRRQIEGSPAAIVIPSSLNDSEEVFLSQFSEIIA